MLGSRLVVAGVSSGVGKTTVATGLLAAFTARGTKVAGAKVGPDFIDPGYHSLACGRPARNLDPWLCGADAIPALAARASRGADLLIVEGVMGLFDGANDGALSSTADVALLLNAPVILVVDVASMSSSVAAVVRGFRDHDPRVTIAGLVLNRVGSAVHEQLLREALEPLAIPVLGVLQRNEALVWRDRHLGLIPVAEQSETVRSALSRLATVVTASFDLAAIEAVARGAARVAVSPLAVAARVGSCRIAVAAGPAFTFCYPDNLEALEAAGAEVFPFDPLTAPKLPDGINGLLAGGGFPEVYGEGLSANTSLLADTAARVGAGLPTWAECGGMLWLANDLDGRAMVGAVPASARLGPRLVLGYRRAETLVASPIGPVGTVLRGHEFHYSTCTPDGSAFRLRSRFADTLDGFATPTMMSTYLHHHAGGDPTIIENFVRACVSAA